MYKLNENGRTNWVTEIEHILYSHGFGYVWLEHQVGNDKLFLQEFKRRMCDIDIQSWLGQIKENNKLDCYRKFKTCLIFILCKTI